ncbi:rRNA processing [Hyphopichia burtonii NRRL Y-1933]|uniref:rRNA-processing protein FYV7 n=1 Tax=Hyphopichia burtonii NRRL Y-1933 TaxID=984485 RepID=A0A1E4RP60_9ASCO|nr:rRNA processing [Hyphopichia burtonii NRRL Y-1933]ODV69062.1 rRNA processing [Hyphopichia burtonii NRRL Y-1933]
MAGPQGRSKPFRGKKPIKDLREFKSREIKKSLVHRARLRKNYFKLLEKEGESTPNDLVEERRQKKPTNFAERSKLAKQKKEERRLKKIEEVRARRQILEKQTRDREKRKESLSKRTRSGQPLMGPRINNLLDKIKEDMK